MTTALFPLLARVLLALMFAQSGYAALSNPAGTAAYFAGLALPLPDLLPWAVGAFELLAALCLIAGIVTRPVAALLAVFAVAASVLGHYGQGETSQLAFFHQQMLLKDIAVAGGLILLAIHGPGAFSVDARRG
ncbi:MAG: DoxX family protein [Rhizobiaceae bacterium]|nr:DoxX family protein [Rhizobiaceae bacterium]